MSALPQYVAVSYSDTQSAMNPASLSVTMTLFERDVDLSDLFGKSATANATSSRTSTGETNPLSRTVVSQFASTDNSFSTPQNSAAIGREGQGAFEAVCDADTSTLVVWNPADTNIYLLPTSGTFAATELALGYAPVAVAAGGGKIYVARSGVAQLAVYDASNAQSLGTVTLPAAPALLAYHDVVDKLYISYQTGTDISRLDTATNTVDQTIAAGYTPALLRARDDAAGNGVFAVGASGGAFHLFEYGGDGAQVRDITLGLEQPQDMAFLSGGYVYLSNFSANTVTRIRLSDNAATDVAVANLPKKMFARGLSTVSVISSGRHSISTVTGEATTSSTSTPDAPPAAGRLCGSSIYLVEDIWQVAAQESAVISASIRDAAGNTGAGSVTILVQPDSPGGV